MDRPRDTSLHTASSQDLTRSEEAAHQAISDRLTDLRRPRLPRWGVTVILCARMRLPGCSLAAVALLGDSYRGCKNSGQN